MGTVPFVTFAEAGMMRQVRRDEWKYETRTEEAVKGALVALLARKPLAEVTVAELAREAGVSRSTFYEHFGNTADVYDALVSDFSHDVSPLMDQVACTGSFRPRGKPFCEQLRENGPRAAVVGEDRFLNAYLTQTQGLEQHDLYGLLTGAGYSDAQARALCSFQMTGCFSAATSSKATGEEWEGIKAVIDRFILGGIAACLAAKGDEARS